ncbi:hypothetical protein [Streptomyces sp. NPDC093111]|uniref:hypothetical protein n=1 Tax=Streptomyces sp. NPDC093111 TaxID=3154978 RepID=UPI0034236CF7
MDPRRTSAALLASLGVIAGALLSTAAPAQAYETLTVRTARVDTDDCSRLSGTLAVTASTYGCYLYDSVDDTYFVKDPGGEAAKMELWNGGDQVAKVEFHPYDRNLWVYDTSNDGDTVYVRVYSTRRAQWSPVYYAVGTSKDVDVHRITPQDEPWFAAIAENEDLIVEVYDNSDATKPLGRVWARA